VEVSDAVIIGAGPNGLAAAAYLARAGWDVTVLERSDAVGGAVRSQALTQPGFVHDTFSAFNGVLHASPVFRELGLDRRVEWRHFRMPVSVLTSPDEAGRLYTDPARTASELGQDAGPWGDLVALWNHVGRKLFDLLLAPVGAVRPVAKVARASGIRGGMDLAKMQLTSLQSLVEQRFSTPLGRALFASGISHTDLAIDAPGSVPGAMILAMLAQDVGMPVPMGGAQSLADAMADAAREAGARIHTGDAATHVVIEGGRAVGVETEAGAGYRVRRAIVADTGPVALFRDLVSEGQLPKRYLDGLRAFRYGSGVFKIDAALDGPITWAADGLEECGVVHVTGDVDDMARTAHQVGAGLLPQAPMLVVGQQSVADPTRAPAGKHTLWLECHVPGAPRGDSTGDITTVGWDDSTRDAFEERVLDRLEKHAPGIRSRILARAIQTPVDLERANPNLVGGDVGGGSNSLDQQLVFRPVPGWFRYRTPIKGLYLCSASTHPGGGVHGMCGRNCANRVLRDSRLRRGR
jgi:phytoene dehydrogenase-like protein